jgi:TonB family protein
MTFKSKYDATTAVDDKPPMASHEVAASGEFPKEFRKTIWENFDARFTAILVLTLLVNFGGIAYLVMNPPPQMSDSELNRIQERFAKFVLDKPPVEPETKFVETKPPEELPPEPANTGRSEGAVSATGIQRSGTQGASSGGAVPDYTGGASLAGALGRRTREQITNEVSRAGILGLLTSNSGLASGEAADDVLSSTNAPMTNLDDALANVGSIKRGNASEADKPLGGGESGREVRGSRATNAGGIDALVQGLGEGKAKSVQRSGDLVVGNEEPLIEAEDGIVGGSRDQDAVAAIVAKHTSAIQYCYQRELKRSPNLKGKLVVRFVITPQGAVSNATVVSSTLNNSTVENCVVERIKRWDDFGAIDPSKGNTTIRQIYTFGY